MGQKQDIFKNTRNSSHIKFLLKKNCFYDSHRVYDLLFNFENQTQKKSYPSGILQAITIKFALSRMIHFVVNYKD